MAASPAAIARADAHRAYIARTWRRSTPAQQARALGLSLHYVLRLRSQLIRAGVCDPTQRAGKARPWATATIREIITRIRAGYDLEAIAPHYGVTPDSISAALLARGYTVEQLRAGHVWTQYGLARLFGVDTYTMEVWVRAGWLVPTTPPTRRKARRLFTRAGVQVMLRNRLTWPAWAPEQIADADLRAYARFARTQAGGRWVKAQDKARRMGYSPRSVGSLVRHGTFGAETVRVAGAWFVWEVV